MDCGSLVCHNGIISLNVTLQTSVACMRVPDIPLFLSFLEMRDFFRSIYRSTTLVPVEAGVDEERL
jgi:hypothetical protein